MEIGQLQEVSTVSYYLSNVKTSNGSSDIKKNQFKVTCVFYRRFLKTTQFERAHTFKIIAIRIVSCTELT